MRTSIWALALFIIAVSTYYKNTDTYSDDVVLV